MAETNPHDAVASSANDQPGRPYYENLRSTLRGTLAKKKQLDEQLAALEDNIFKLETSYLEETSGAGNVVRGFDNWVKGVVVGNEKGRDDRKARARVRDEDRIFSRSSMLWMRVGRPTFFPVFMRDHLLMSTQAQESPADSSNANTPSHAPTPSSSVPPALSVRGSDLATPGSTTSKAAPKKKKAADKEEHEDSKPAKRSKISYGRAG